MENQDNQIEKNSISNPLINNKNIIDEKHQLQNHNKQFFKFDDITQIEKWAYGVGHFLNDISAAMWFFFFSVYIKEVNPVSQTSRGFYAGLIILCGQITDAIVTPTIGILSDRTNTRIGKRKPWYICGSIIVLITLILIFQECFLCQKINSFTFRVTYVIFFPVLGNIGWPMAQVSHMSLIPSLSCSRQMRDTLNGLRNTFTYIAQFTVLSLAVILFIFITEDLIKFRILSISVSVLGFCFSIYFIITINEPQLQRNVIEYSGKIQQYINYKIKINGEKFQYDKKNVEYQQNEIQQLNEEENNAYFNNNQNQVENRWKLSYNFSSKLYFPEEQQENNIEVEKVKWTSWFKRTDFYLYGILYMTVRIVNNCTMTFIIFYLLYVVVFSTQVSTQNNLMPYQLALIPMVIMIFSVISSYFQIHLIKKLGRQSIFENIINFFIRKNSFTMATMSFITSSVILIVNFCFIIYNHIKFLTPKQKQVMYIVAVLLGFGQSIALNMFNFFYLNGIAMISEVIGQKEQGSAFVFGAYSLLDKLSNGILLFVTLSAKPFENNNPEFIRWITVIIPSTAFIIAWFVVLIGKGHDYQNIKNSIINQKYGSIFSLFNDFVSNQVKE